MLFGYKISSSVYVLVKRQVKLMLPLPFLAQLPPPPDNISEARLDTLVKHILDFNSQS